MGTVKANIIEGALTRTPLGYTTTRTFLVSDLSGETGSGRMYRATLEPGIPVPGVTRHPDMTFLTCNKITASIVHDNAIKIVASYITTTVPALPELPPLPPPQIGDPPIFSGGATIQSQTTTVDIDGNITQWEDIAPPLPPPEKGCNNLDWVPGLTCIGPIEMSVSRPMYTRNVGRLEIHTVESVDELCSTYVGTMNSTLWGGWVPKSGLCTSIQYTLVSVGTDDPTPGGPNEPNTIYSVSYEFQKTSRPDGWDNVLVGVVDGKIIQWADPKTNLGIRKFVVYAETDFNELQL